MKDWIKYPLIMLGVLILIILINLMLKRDWGQAGETVWWVWVAIIIYWIFKKKKNK